MTQEISVGCHSPKDLDGSSTQAVHLFPLSSSTIATGETKASQETILRIWVMKTVTQSKWILSRSREVGRRKKYIKFRKGAKSFFVIVITSHTSVKP